jgi:hypothetical protein
MNEWDQSSKGGFIDAPATEIENTHQFLNSSRQAPDGTILEDNHDGNTYEQERH